MEETKICNLKIFFHNRLFLYMEPIAVCIDRISTEHIFCV